LSVTSIHILAADTGLQPHVLRAAAEHFGASVTVTWVGNSAQVVDYLSSRPPQEVIVLSFHGDERGLVLPPLDEECRSLFPYLDVIRAEDFGQFLDLAGSVVLNNACLGGTPQMAEAFLVGGASSYIRAEDSPDTAASTKYVLDFLYGFLIQYPGDVEKSHQAARNAKDDRGMFSLYVAS
jgi:hypothetical protein